MFKDDESDIDLKTMLNSIWNDAIIGMAVVESDGKFRYVNPKFCDITEYTESELQHKTFQDITHPDDLYHDQYLANRLSKAADVYDIKSYNMKKRYLTKTGSVVWVTMKVVRVDDYENSGGFKYFIAMISEMDSIKITHKDLDDTDSMFSYFKRTKLLRFIRRNSVFIMAIITILIFVLSKIIEIGIFDI